MVDVVDDEVRWGVHYRTMNLKGFSTMFSNSVKCVAGTFGVPLKFYQLVIIASVNDSEFALGEGDRPDGAAPEFGKRARLEIGAGIGESDYPLGRGETGLGPAGEDRTAVAVYVERKIAVVATNFSYNFSHR